MLSARIGSTAMILEIAACSTGGGDGAVGNDSGLPDGAEEIDFSVGKKE